MLLRYSSSSFSPLVHLLFFTVLFSNLAAQSGQPIALGNDKLHFTLDKTVVNLGLIDKDAVCHAEFIISNTGEVPVNLINAQANCGCLSVEWPHQPIAHVETAVIRTTMHANLVGPFFKYIMLSIEGYGQVQLDIRGEVKFVETIGIDTTHNTLDYANNYGDHFAINKAIFITDPLPVGVYHQDSLIVTNYSANDLVIYPDDTVRSGILLNWKRLVAVRSGKQLVLHFWVKPSNSGSFLYYLPFRTAANRQLIQLPVKGIAN